MDSKRLIINNIDQSTATVMEDTPVIGYTVVKAPKGPITPTLIKRSSPDLQTIFGSSSTEYPELYEAEKFNKSYPLYVSAPYDPTKTKIPVAYVTDDGIFPGANLVTYTEDIEGLNNGELKEHIAGIQAISENTPVLKNTKYAISENVYEKQKISKKIVEIKLETPGVEDATVSLAKKKEDVVNKGDTLFTYTASDKPGVEFKSTVSGTIAEIITDGKQVNTGAIVAKIITDAQEDLETYVQDAGSAAVPFNSTVTVSNEIILDSIIIPTKLPARAFKNGQCLRIANLPIQNTVNEDHPCNWADYKLNSVKGNIASVGQITYHLLGYVSTADLSSSSITSDIDSLKIEKFDNVKSATGMLVKKGETGYEPFTGSLQSSEEVYIAITGANYDAETSSKNPLIADNIKILKDVKVCEKLRSYYIAFMKSEQFHASIFTKYPGTTSLELNFRPFVKKEGYEAITAEGRNIVFADIVEVETGKHASVRGTINEVAEISTFKPFTSSNIDYVQELVSIVTTDAEPFKLTTPFFRGITNYPPIVLEGGIREFPENVYEVGWNKAKDAEYASVDLFFDPRRHENTEGLDEDRFYQLAKDQQLAGYIFNVTMSPGEVDAYSSKSSIPELTFGARYWNTCNEAIVQLRDANGASRGRIMSPMTGLKAAMQAAIIEKRYGGVAPMYLNTGDGLGGQLRDSNIIALRYNYDKDQQMLLDAANYNPVIKDSTYGVMSVGQKTCKDGLTTDWSYIGHVSSFLNFQKEMKEQVMTPQLGKANNDYYRSLRKMNTESLLEKRTSGNNRIWAQAVVDTSTAEGVNDAAARRARKFVIDVKVKVDVFSEWVVLNFTNVDQATQL